MRRSYDAPDGLEDGTWEPDGPILRWTPAPLLPSFQRDHLYLACPTCHARIDQLCRTRTGHHRTPHTSRLVPKRCGCGETIGFNRKLCDTCRDDARRENGRRGMQATRARRRAA